MAIIHHPEEIDTTIEKRFAWFYKRFKIGNILHRINADKEKGVAVGRLLSFIVGLVFTYKNLYTLFADKSTRMSFGNDTVYRFMNRPAVNWEKLAPLLAVEIIPEIEKLTDDTRRSALIIDDTPYYRNRSKKVELLSWCKDHSENRYYKGFTLLNMGWSDGVTFVPVDFQLVASGNDRNLLEESHIKEDHRTIATRRRKAARTEKPELVLQMLQRVKGTPAQTQHVLFDSWFNSPKAIMGIKHLGYDAVSRCKNNENYRYLYEGQSRSISQIHRMSKKRPGSSRYLLSVKVQVQHADFEKKVDAKIVYVRDRNDRKKWIALISTDISLSEEEVITLYAKRWDIEPFHKFIKSTLRLTKEFLLRSFDGITAHTAMVFVRYLFLSYESRINADNRAIGGLFIDICDELADISFTHAFWIMMELLKSCLADFAGWAAGYIQALIDRFITSLPAFISDRLRFCVCES